MYTTRYKKSPHELLRPKGGNNATIQQMLGQTHFSNDRNRRQVNTLTHSVEKEIDAEEMLKTLGTQSYHVVSPLIGI